MRLSKRTPPPRTREEVEGQLIIVAVAAKQWPQDSIQYELAHRNINNLLDERETAQ